MRKSALRRWTVLAGLILVVVGLAIHKGIGTLSAFGWEDVALICPLGSLETILASRTLVPQVLISLVVVGVLTALLGRIFCGWICPIPPLKRFVGSRGRSRSDGEAPVHDELSDMADQRDLPVDAALSCGEVDGATCSAEAPHADGAKGGSERRRLPLDSRHAVLGAALVSSLVFGFPVFCLVCPVGLVLGLVLAVWFAFTAAEVSWSLAVIPAVLVVELLLLRSWCHRFCPMGALLSLLAIPNRLFRPAVSDSRCLRVAGASCSACARACDEGLDPHSVRGMNECTKCGRCQEACPAGAISFPPYRRQADSICDEARGALESEQRYGD